MSDPAILFVKPKVISAKDKKALQTAGVIVVEVDDVNNVKFVRAYAELSTTEMLSAAADAISKGSGGNYGYDIKKLFAEAICAAILAKQKSP